MTIPEFLERVKSFLDNGDFELILDKMFVLEREDIETLIPMLVDVFPDEMATALENNFTQFLESAFITYHIELPLNITDFIESYDYNILGYTKEEIVDYLRKHGLKYGVKIVDNPIYGEPYIQYIKEI